uniref:non-specific serine/threonine protein kinase n=1 Tax=Lactuca sativa TaxID=4236 RepID=A0A9R1UIL9_LACSA|nr:hypothetical protein LSAT_V11C900503030 [Lactuca sativa]
MVQTIPVILYWFLLVFYNLLRVYGNAEADVLRVLKAQLSDPTNVLQSWDPISVSPCSWYHVTCDSWNRSVTRVDLQNAGLSGQLVKQLGQLTYLRYLELYANNISGKIPEELGNLTNLMSLDLYMNHRLNNNSLTGTIPVSLTGIDSLQVLFANNPDLTLVVVPQAQAPSQSPSVGNNHTGAIVGAIAAVVVLFVALALWRDRKQQLQVDSFTFLAEEDPKVHLRQLKTFSLRELQAATHDFSNRNILGEGAFGKVYKGLLADGSLVAVKRLTDHVHGGELHFQKEVEIISMAVHRNLLRLQGFCMTSTEPLLVYPYMANGSVASFLRDRPDRQPALDWPTRKQIALGSARGLAYLHDHCDPKIIHRDVKASNILLDEEFEAVVADFGLAKLMNYNDTHVTTAVCGTIGHIAPEYLSTGRCSEKSDVYGYGVMLLQLITRQQAYDPTRLANNHNDVMLLDWVKRLLEDKKLEMLVDADLEGNYLKDGVEELIKIALLCTQVTPSERPKMSEVVKMLEGFGLAERWEEWQKGEIFLQDFSQEHNLNIDCVIVDSTYNLSNDQLSGPR